ncbi:LysR family transcriptional regulator [Faunimonas sp. B44]|uniref:LysR family transcriptional regulator n=1 Tax=Faunimonas sp. B44 TaxID=3461493 RepID=UPI004043E981
MPGLLSLHRLRYFLAIAEHGSISAAARALNVAQPALSYHVNELERLTGLALLTRSNDGVLLTEAGKLLRRHAAEIVARADAAEEALARLARRTAAVPRVRIAVITSLAAALTPLLVDRVAPEPDRVTLSIVEAGTRDIKLKLDKGLIDMAVSLGPSGRTEDRPIAYERLWFLTQEGAERGDIRLAEIAPYPLVLPASGNPLRELIDHTFEARGLTMNLVLEVDGQNSRRKAVSSGIGSTILGSHSIGMETGDGPVARRIVAPDLYRPIFLDCRPGLDAALAARMTRILKSALLELGLSATAPG